MGEPLRVLMVEDSEDDAQLLLRELSRGGFEPIVERVDTREAMLAALELGRWDVVIADYVMPRFSGLAALALLRERGLDLPFIVVSGKIGEETAVEAMKAGAHDYIAKDNPARLTAAIRRELREATVRRERRRAEEGLREVHEELEARVKERTADLAQANEQLRREIAQRERAEQELERLAAEAQRRAAELDAIIESMVDAVYVADARGMLVRANKAGLQMVGLKPNEGTIWPLHEYSRLAIYRDRDGRVIPPEEYALAKALRGETFSGYVFSGELPDGRVYWTSVSGAPVRDKKGNIIAAVNVTRDVTAQLEAEKERERLLAELTAQHELFRTVVDNAPAGIAVVGGPDMSYQLVNPAYQATAPGKQMQGRPWAEVWAEVAAQVQPIVDQVMRTGKPFLALDAPYRVRRAPGAPLEEAYFTFSYVRIPDQTGGYALLVATHETTEEVRARKRIEELAETAHRRAAELQAIIDNMVGGVFVCDSEHNITLANEAGLRLLGMTSLEEIERALAEYPEILRVRQLNGSPLKSGELPLARALTGQVVTQEDLMVFVPARQRDVYVRVSASPIRNEKGKIPSARSKWRTTLPSSQSSTVSKISSSRSLRTSSRRR